MSLDEIYLETVTSFNDLLIEDVLRKKDGPGPGPLP